MDSEKHRLQKRVEKVPDMPVAMRSNLSEFETVEIESERNVVPDIPVAMRSNLSEFETVEIERDVAPKMSVVPIPYASECKTIEIESERDDVERDDVPDIPVAMCSNLSEFETVEIERDVAPKMSVVPIPYASEFKTIEIESEQDDVERDDGMSSSSSTPPIPYQLHSELTFSVVEAAIVLALIFIQMFSIISVA